MYSYSTEIKIRLCPFESYANLINCNSSMSSKENTFYSHRLKETSMLKVNGSCALNVNDYRTHSIVTSIVNIKIQIQQWYHGNEPLWDSLLKHTTIHPSSGEKDEGFGEMVKMEMLVEAENESTRRVLLEHQVNIKYADSSNIPGKDVANKHDRGTILPLSYSAISSR